MNSSTPSVITLIRYALCILFVVAIAEMIGNVSIPLGGSAQIVLLPLLWAILIGGILAAVLQQAPADVRLTSEDQGRIGVYLSFALMPFLVKLGFTVGSSLPQVKDAGWALFFQEFGHFFGTMCVGLPIALLLGIKREAIGATFSVGREPSLAIIGQRFGMNSPEGRGVMAEYITGTVIGALFVGLLASLFTSLNLFDPRSLAMGAGLGSGSMMAAGAGAISAQVSPEIAKEVQAVAAAANLLTSVFGVYFTLFISLPLTIWLYEHMEPILGRFGKAHGTVEKESIDADGSDSQGVPKISMLEKFLVWGATCLLALIGNMMTYKVSFIDALPGAMIILAIVVVSDLVLRFVPILPSVFVLCTFAMIAGVPDLFPFSNQVIAWVTEVNFLPFTTVILAMAGLSILKDLPAFRKLGWRIVVVSLSATTGTFLGATLIAEFFH